METPWSHHCWLTSSSCFLALFHPFLYNFSVWYLWSTQQNSPPAVYCMNKYRDSFCRIVILEWQIAPEGITIVEPGGNLITSLRSHRIRCPPKVGSNLLRAVITHHPKGDCLSWHGQSSMCSAQSQKWCRQRHCWEHCIWGQDIFWKGVQGNWRSMCIGEGTRWQKQLLIMHQSTVERGRHQNQLLTWHESSNLDDRNIAVKQVWNSGVHSAIQKISWDL